MTAARPPEGRDGIFADLPAPLAGTAAAPHRRVARTVPDASAGASPGYRSLRDGFGPGKNTDGRNTGAPQPRSINLPFCRRAGPADPAHLPDANGAALRYVKRADPGFDPRRLAARVVASAERRSALGAASDGTRGRG